MADDAPLSPAVQASNDNSQLILEAVKDAKTDLVERINTSDKRTDERFQEQDKVLVAHREQLGSQIGELTVQVKATNGGLQQVKGKVEIIEDRAGQIAKRAGEKLTLRQGLVIAAVGAAVATFGLIILHIAGF